MDNRNERRYRISPVSGELTYNPHADTGLRRTRSAASEHFNSQNKGATGQTPEKKGAILDEAGSGSPDRRIVLPHGEEEKSFLEKRAEIRATGGLSAEEKGAMLDKAGYPFGRALSFTSPTGCDSRTHDEVVGGGHTIEVQDENINQIGKFQHAGKLAGFGNNPNMSRNATAGEPLMDNFGVGHPVNSVFNDTHTDVYGDFMPENTNKNRDFGATGAIEEENSTDEKEDVNDKNDRAVTVKSGESGRPDRHKVLPHGEKNYNFGATGTIEEENSTDEKEDVNDKNDRAVTVKSGDKVIKTIVIAGQIEGHTQLPQGQKATRYEELIPQLVEIEESDEIEGLLIILNTVGGDVEAGLALSEMIAGMKKPTASLVLGGGHSIGVPLAVSAKRSFIVPSATMTLHPVRVTGMVLSAPQTYVYLNNMQERIIDFTCSHCNITHDRFYELMLAREEMSTDLGSVLDGKKAVEEGLIDALGTLADAIRFLKGEK